MSRIIDRSALLSLIEGAAPPVIIDTLPVTAYQRGHIPGAISIPSDDIIARAPAEIPNRDTPIVVYCKNGPCKRSNLSAERLDALGYTAVYDYDAGREDWAAGGHPLEPAAQEGPQPGQSPS